MLEGKIALVTGAGRGIGRAVALKLAGQGAVVVVNYNGSKERAEEVVKTILENGGTASAYQCSVSDFEACEKMIKDVIAQYGHLDILVNNAGITRDGLIMKMKEEDFDAVLDTNLKGAFNMIRHMAGLFIRAREGCIINITSVSGMMGNAGQCNYSASKAGLIGLTKSVAKELAPKGIRCNAVAPGFIATDMTGNQTDNPLLDMIPLSKMGEPEDVADAVAYLAAAKYVTGEVLRVDGGIAM